MRFLKRMFSRRVARPFLSTIVVGVFVAGVLLFINIPGSRYSYGRNHGWPLVYLYRAAKRPPDPPGERATWCGPYRISAIWSLTQDVEEFRPLMLLGNVCIVIGCGVAAAIAWQFWRKRTASPIRLSLRFLLLLVLLCSLFFGWIRHRAVRSHHEQLVVSELKRRGATVYYRTLLPEWLRAMLTDNYGRPFDDVTYVSLFSGYVTDEDLKLLSSLRNIRELDLSRTNITDASLAHVAPLHQLNRLILTETAITDDGLAHLSSLKRLTYLNLDATKVTGSGLEHLRPLEQLEHISLCETLLSDQYLSHLAALPRLAVLYTRDTKVSREGAEEFRQTSRNHLGINSEWPRTIDEYADASELEAFLDGYSAEGENADEGENEPSTATDSDNPFE